METHINPNKYYSRIFCSLYIKSVDLPNYILLLDRLINNHFCKKMLLNTFMLLGAERVQD